MPPICVKGNTQAGTAILWPRLRKGHVIDYRRRVPVGIEMVVGSREWPHSRPKLVQVGNNVPRIGS